MHYLQTWEIWIPFLVRSLTCIWPKAFYESFGLIGKMYSKMLCFIRILGQNIKALYRDFYLDPSSPQSPITLHSQQGMASDLPLSPNSILHSAQIRVFHSTTYRSPRIPLNTLSTTTSIEVTHWLKNLPVQLLPGKQTELWLRALHTLNIQLILDAYEAFPNHSSW